MTTTKKTGPEIVMPDGTAVIVNGPTIIAEHDLSNHPAVQSGMVRNTGDTALKRDPNAPNFKRPILERR